MKSDITNISHSTNEARLRRRSVRRAGLIAGVVITALLSFTQVASAMTLFAPADHQSFEYVQLHPTVMADAAQGETVKWVLLGADAQMTKKVRYCRQWYQGMVDPTIQDVVDDINVQPTAPTSPTAPVDPTPVANPADDLPTVHLACNVWSIGVDAYGNDMERPLKPGGTYWWTVVYTDAQGAEQQTPIRSFAISNLPPIGDPGALSDSIMKFVTGSKLNLGKAAFAQSGLRVDSIKSRRISATRLRIELGYTGGVDLAHSYVIVKGVGRTRTIHLARFGGSGAVAKWNRGADEARLATGKYTYQAHLRSLRNGAMVVSQMRVVIVRRKAGAAATTRIKPM